MSRIAIFALAAVLAFALAAPAFANGSGGAGVYFGQHHAMHAQEKSDVDKGGFTGTDNPGMHEGFSGWTHE